MKKLYLIFICLIIFSSIFPYISNSQKRNSNWIIKHNNYRLLHFNEKGIDSITPIISEVSDLMSLPYSTISDTSGSLILSVGNNCLYDSNYKDIFPQWFKHGIIYNSYYRILLVPCPRNDNKYYSFSFVSGHRFNGINYKFDLMDFEKDYIYTVDFNKNNKDKVSRILLPTKHSGPIAGCVHGNGTDIWIVRFDPINMNITSYLVTEEGPIRDTVINNLSIDLAKWTVYNERVTPAYYTWSFPINIKFSPDGTLLGTFQTMKGEPVIYHFDKYTGKISEPIILKKSVLDTVRTDTLSYFESEYHDGCEHHYYYRVWDWGNKLLDSEFSSDGTKIYFTVGLLPNYYYKNKPKLYQYDLYKKAINDIDGSLAEIDDLPGNWYSFLTLATDGRIYGSKNGDHGLVLDKPDEEKFWVINNPNDPHPLCKATYDIYALNGENIRGMFIQDFTNNQIKYFPEIYLCRGSSPQDNLLDSLKGEFLYYKFYAIESQKYADYPVTLNGEVLNPKDTMLISEMPVIDCESDGNNLERQQVYDFEITCYYLFEEDTMSVNWMRSVRLQPNTDLKIDTIDQKTSCKSYELIAITNHDEAIISYLWSTGDTTKSILVNKSGIYSVECYNKYGCYSRDSIEILLPDNPEVSILAESDYFCKGDSLLLKSSNDFSYYEWFYEGEYISNDKSILAYREGEYQLNIIDINTCTRSDTIFIDERPSPRAKIVGDSIVYDEPKTKLRVSGYNLSYINWSTGEETLEIEISESGYYYVIVATSQGCKDSVGINVRFLQSSDVIASKNQENLLSFPNPATSHITLSLGEEFISEPEIDIIDYLGNVIRWTPSGRWSPSDKSITINTSSLSPGVYFLRIRSGEKVEVRKFVVL
jgi:hypothetical protein